MAELIGELADAGADLGATVVLETRERTRPGERRGGALPAEVIEVVVSAAGGALVERVAGVCFDVVREWVTRRRRADRRHREDVTIVRIFGPNGETPRDVTVDEGRPITDDWK